MLLGADPVGLGEPAGELGVRSTVPRTAGETGARWRSRSPAGAQVCVWLRLAKLRPHEGQRHISGTGPAYAAGPTVLPRRRPGSGTAWYPDSCAAPRPGPRPGTPVTPRSTR